MVEAAPNRASALKLEPEVVSIRRNRSNSLGSQNPPRKTLRRARILLPLALFTLVSFAAAQQKELPQAPDPEFPPAQQASQLPGAPIPTSIPARIHGIVQDKSGSVYEGARVTLTQPGTTSPLVTTTDSSGAFAFTAVAPGPFKLTVATAGFAARPLSGTLQPGQSLETPPILLTMNSASSEVDVSASTVEIATQQLQLEETQRVLGVFPNFYVTYAPNAAPLSRKQKFSLAWKSSIDPVTFLATGVIAGIEQATNSFSGYGQGVQGYAKRYGAGYADGFIATMIGGAILPSWWKQDPRYFYKGTGTKRSRILYALANAVICKGDNGHWQPNYSAIIGGLAAGGISNLYYPASDRNGVGLTFENAGYGTIGSAIGNLVQEFLVKRLTPKLPNYSSTQP